MDPMRILLLGGSGLLGGPMARTLLAAGHTVTVLTRGGRGVAPGAESLVADRLATDGAELDRVLRGRTFDLTVNSSGVPTDATAVMVSLLLVNCAAGNGNFTIWANGAARPTANNMVWGGTAARYSSLAVTAVDNAGKCQVVSALATDFVLDVAGYFT